MVDKNKKMANKKTKHIKIRVTEDEREKWKKTAQDAGVSLADLLRQSLGKVRTWTSGNQELERRKVFEISRIANNLEQISRWCNHHKSDAECVQIIPYLLAVKNELNLISKRENAH